MAVKIKETQYTLNKFDRNILYFAKTLALKSEVNGKHAGIAVLDGKIVSKGINYYFPKGNIHRGSTIHAEMATLNKLSQDEVKKCILYVTRSTPSCLGHTFSRPCKRCMKDLISRKVKTVIYSCGNVNEWNNNSCAILLKFIYP